VAEYIRRVVDDELDQLFTALPAVALEGPRGVGKTATAERRASTVFALDDPEQRELLAADPSRITTLPAPVLLDEWQRLPESWDVVRRSVDADRSAGRFLLTGSASPPRPPTHSGAGRIVTLRMRPMALAERGLARPTVSLAALLSGSRPDVTGSTDVPLSVYAEEIVRSGFPGLRHLRGRALRAQLDGWLERVVDRDVPDQGRPVRRPRTLRAWLTAYAAATSTSATLERIRDAATPGEHDKPAKQTVSAYRDVLTQLWVLDPVPGWLPTSNRLSRLSLAPKHHLADPALATRLLGMDETALLSGTPARPTMPREGTLLGALFESLVTLSVRVHAQAAEAGVHHLRTNDGEHEVDLIVQRADQRLVALEVKLAASVADADVRHLRWLEARIGSDLLDAAVITTGTHAYRRPDGIAVVPAALLGP
jgi:uncharacterized protein